MDPGEYRRDYRNYRYALEAERFSQHAGLVIQSDLRPIEERYADLWTREAIGELRNRLEETPAQFETERAGLAALIRVASLKFAGARALEVEEELRRCEESARFDWQGASITMDEAPELIAADSDGLRRRELAARWFEEVRRCDDLRASRLEILDDAALSLGFEGRLALRESLAGASLEGMAAAAGVFLELTARVYMERLSRWAARASASDTPKALQYADSLFLRRVAHLDTYFKVQEFRAAYAGMVAELGVRLEAQPNLRLDEEARPGKAQRSACFPVAPPEDVRLVVGAGRGGAAWQRESFREGGRAQVFAWTSRDLAARHPEFVHAPDRATVEGHAQLFSGLLRDAAWLGGHRGLRATEAGETTAHMALVELHDARRECASLRYAVALAASAKDARSEQPGESYATLHTEATGFAYEPATRLLDDDGVLDASCSLRSRLFAAGLAEHLRGRHGRRWYSSRAAGDELRDLWNTASRYTVEELARLVWGGELSFELLAEQLIGALAGDGDV